MKKRQSIYIILPTIAFVCCIGNITLLAQNDTTHQKANTPKVEKKWYDQLFLRGYFQFRYNRLLETNDQLSCEQCDKSWGQGGGFFMRRIRLVFSAQVSERVLVYIQPDFASSPGNDRLNFGQLRDAYVDIGVDAKSEFRFRVGQSKNPYGFENLQSSQMRLPLDRADAINSAILNERDLGILFFWAPTAKRNLFRDLVNKGLKSSGDYGIAGIGIFNGQNANNPDANKNTHIVGRISYPFFIKKQIVEIGVQGYTGKYTLNKSNLSTQVKYREDLTYTDQRIASSFILYPQPFGLQAEYNIGVGPEFNKATDSIETKPLRGGYVMVMLSCNIRQQHFMPFVRYQYYDGGKKHEKDARSYTINDVELGVEWQPTKYLELVATYTIARRSFEDSSKPDNYQKGSLLRLQAQISF